MWLEVHNLKTKVVRFGPNDKDWLSDYLSFEDVSGRYKRGGKVQRESLYNRAADNFPTGFLPGVLKAAKADGLEIEILDRRKPAVMPDPDADLAWLRDYQVAAVEAIKARGRGLLHLPTGSGKTEIMVGLTRALPCRWLALVHRAQLADDMANRYELRSPGLFAGRILEGGWDVPDFSQLTVATFQSVHRAIDRGPGDERHDRMKKLLESTEALLVDEAHTLPSTTFYNVAMTTRNAFYRVGLSGTPLARGDRRSLFTVAALGPVVYRVKAQLLIDRGVLAKPTVRFATVNQTGVFHQWSSAYSGLVVKSKKRNAVVAELAARAEKPGLLFVQHVEHGKQLVKDLHAAGVRAEFVWGAHSIEWRRSHIKRLVQGHFDVLVCSTIFNEGIDIPELRSVILGAGGKSVIAALQRAGRGMRIDRDAQGAVREGGDTFEVWDIMDTGNKWTERHAKDRLGAYQAEGYQAFVEPESVASFARGAR